MQVHELDGYPAYLPGDLRRFVASSSALSAWVAEEGGVILGHVAMHSRSSVAALTLACETLGEPIERLGVVARLLVAPTARRRGIGRMLLDAARHAASESVKRFETLSFHEI
jgi:GNAT superfamily N-acetyltransferase